MHSSHTDDSPPHCDWLLIKWLHSFVAVAEYHGHLDTCSCAPFAKDTGFAQKAFWKSSRQLNYNIPGRPVATIFGLGHYSQVARAPPGTVACAFDIKAFYWTCLVLPDHKPWLVVSISNIFWIDHDYPFGTRSASSNSGQTGSAVIDIWSAEDIDITFKYEDDMSQLQFPFETGPFINGLHHYHHDCESSLGLIALLNIPWHPTKTGDWFIPVFIFIGFLWDLPLQQVSLPDLKHLKLLNRVVTLIMKSENHKKVSLTDVQKIHGSLVHICFIYLDGNSRLPCLSNFMSLFKEN